jgi:multiple sugar transport system substrate-binding protein
MSRKTQYLVSLAAVCLFLLVAVTAYSEGAAEKQEVRKLTILSHAVHQNVARGTVGECQGGDIAGEWAERNNVELEWITGGIDPIHDRLARELTLRETSIDLVFVIDRLMNPELASRLEPLDAYHQKNPIEALEDIPEGFFLASRHNGHLVSIPYRHSVSGLFWNKVLFEERGLTRPPRTSAELTEYAKRMTYVREDGTEVIGLVGGFGGWSSIQRILVGYGVELFVVNDDGSVTVQANTPEMINGLSVFRELYLYGAVPSNFATISIDDQTAMATSGRAAIIDAPMARYGVYNDPDISDFPGSILPSRHINVTEDQIAPHQMEVWSMAIPQNSANKDLAWDLIRELSTMENTIRAALNGNSPVHPSAYNDPRVVEMYPWKGEEALALLDAETRPIFDNSREAWDIFTEEAHAAVLGIKTPEEAALSMQTRLEDLLY